MYEMKRVKCAYFVSSQLRVTGSFRLSSFSSLSGFDSGKTSPFSVGKGGLSFFNSGRQSSSPSSSALTFSSS